MGSSILVQQCVISSLHYQQLNLYHHQFFKQNYPPSRTVRNTENKHRSGATRASSAALETTNPSSSSSSLSFPLLTPPVEPQDSPASQVTLIIIKNVVLGY